MAILKKIGKKLRPQCSQCGDRFSIFSDKINDLSNLRKVGEYRNTYRAYKHLCPNCWYSLTNSKCSLCKKFLNVFENKKPVLLENFKELGIKNKKVSNAKRICQKCYLELVSRKCEKCQSPTPVNQLITMDYGAKIGIENVLSPYYLDYDSTWEYLCPDCYEKCLNSAAAIKKELKNWVEGNKYKFIRGYRTIKELGKVKVSGDTCKNSEEVENKLKIYSIQKGGNGFINFWWDPHFYQVSEDYLAGYSNNGNPYYKTRYYRKQWYTGHATAVYVKPFEKRRRNTFVTRHHRKNSSPSPILFPPDTSLIIDGLNVCRWKQSDNGKPDLLILMTFLVEVAKKGYDFFCFFDANTPHVLNGNRSEVKYRIYKELIENHKNKFGEVPGRIRADDFILKAADTKLKAADTKKAAIVSNDQFRDYVTLHPWLRDDKRLIKGMVANEKLLIPPLDLDVPLRKDLKKSLRTFQKNLNF